MRADRTWPWGPRPWFDYYEFYRDAPNGLLAVEMVGGQQKLGDNPWDNAWNLPGYGSPGTWGIYSVSIYGAHYSS